MPTLFLLLTIFVLVTIFDRDNNSAACFSIHDVHHPTIYQNKVALRLRGVVTYIQPTRAAAILGVDLGISGLIYN